jgi:anti-sigma regulatory factor (Ser/Thr protein kinase)
MTERRQFPHDANSVKDGRQFVDAVLTGVPLGVRQAAGLMVSELATNAVVHGASPFVIDVDRTESQVRIEVFDEGRGVPQLGAPSPSDPNGRGLRIVDRLSDNWGVGVRSVWFVLDLKERSGTGRRHSTDVPSQGP